MKIVQVQKHEYVNGIISIISKKQFISPKLRWGMWGFGMGKRWEIGKRGELYSDYIIPKIKRKK